MKRRSILLCSAAVLVVVGCSQLNDDVNQVAENRCRACHAFPPEGSLHATHTDAQHYNCSLCHPGGASTDGPSTSGPFHNNGTQDVVVTYPFQIPDSSIHPVYDRTTARCASVYCHGAFFGGNDSGTVSVGDTGLVECGTCHSVPPATYPHDEDSHSEFVYQCELCHPGYDSTQGIPSAETHVNGMTEASLTVRETNPVCLDCH